MKSAQLVGPRTIEVVETALAPDPGPGEIFLKLRSVGICGSDMHWYTDGQIYGFPASYPQILGHEPAGEIAAVGTGVTGLKPGASIRLKTSF